MGMLGTRRAPPPTYELGMTTRVWGGVFVATAVSAVVGLFQAGGGPPVQEGAHPNFRGEPVEQIYSKLPALRPYYTKFEEDYNVGPLLMFSKEEWWVPIGAVSAYLAMVWLGPPLMKAVSPDGGPRLQLPLAAWNWLLAVFSFLGAVRTVPHLLYTLSSGSFENTICDAPDATWGIGATGLWVQLFIFSKIPELVDTVLIVVRQRKLLFLHWYHHVTVLLYCWHAYATECGAGLYFVAMNYTVHAMMYAYYAAMALRLVPKWFPPILVTAAQIAQMFVGIFVCGASIYYYYERRESASPCRNDPTNLVLGSAMYLSYLLLFVDFAVKKYLA
eukprot:TRINITY_DN1320_c1_g5_i1.p2 TRINITY_DN1320_c1_g5~~TRINITY_DN1320_c1_g5_i1.p2  ORF type:complete len:331 (+),score=137.58 TRINITY_DN1320_c1_g5_i1:93-1085(+)